VQDDSGQHDFSVQAVHAYNGNHTLYTANGYVLDLDGTRIYISGDTGAQPEIRALDDIDVAFVCMNQFTMTLNEAASVVRDIDPHVVIPYHYSSQNLATFTTQVGTDLGIEVRLLNWYPPL
jgi:L-ascorbate metabolism protein UlaG (beta-lactamase superfamily)